MQWQNLHSQRNTGVIHIAAYLPLTYRTRVLIVSVRMFIITNRQPANRLSDKNSANKKRKIFHIAILETIVETIYYSLNFYIVLRFLSLFCINCLSFPDHSSLLHICKYNSIITIIRCVAVLNFVHKFSLNCGGDCCCFLTPELTNQLSEIPSFPVIASVSIVMYTLHFIKIQLVTNLKRLYLNLCTFFALINAFHMLKNLFWNFSSVDTKIKLH